jgi:choline kinase
VNALILAAGRGSRLAELTDEQPKCLTRLADRTLLEWQLEALRGGGASEVHLVTGYRAETLADQGLTTFHNPRWSETNMVVSLACAGELLREHACLISYADIVYPPRYVERLIEAPGEFVLAYDLDWEELWRARFADPYEDAESFVVDASGRLLEIGVSRPDPSRVQGQYMGLLKSTPSGWRRIEAHLEALPQSARDRLDMTSLLASLLAEGAEISTLPVRGGWCEVDHGSDLQLYERLIAEGSWSHDWRG